MVIAIDAVSIVGFAEYILMNPSEEYRCIMQRVYEKMSLSKV